MCLRSSSSTIRASTRPTGSRSSSKRLGLLRRTRPRRGVASSAPRPGRLRAPTMAPRDPGGLSGVLVVDKPSGPTSHDVVDRVRAALATRRAGHTGTLDPFATGVLPVCVGRATRLVRFLASGTKTYRASVRLGFATTTDDLTG